MPAIRLLGRKWLIASDDFVVSSIFELLVRFISWLVVIVLVAQIYYPYTFTCPNGWDGGTYVRLFLCGILTLQGIHSILLAVLAYLSSRGSIMNVQARKNVEAILLLKLFLILPDIVLNVMGTVWVFSGSIRCPIYNGSQTVLMLCIVIFYWLLVAFTFIGIIVSYDPLGNVSNAEIEEKVREVRLKRKSKGLWSWRFKCAFGCVKRKEHRKEIFEQVAALFYSILRTTNFVPSDVVAGMILLGVREKQEQAKEIKSIQPQMQGPQKEWMNLENAIHYLKLAAASYGCLLAMYQNLFTGPCNLIKHLSCGCLRGRNPRVTGDNCCLCNFAGVKLLSNYSEENIVIASFNNDDFEVPFYVVVDRERREVIVAVRGTLSFKDIFTDCTAWSEKFEADDKDLPENTTVHKGFSLSTNKTLERLLPVLEETFDENPNYRLVVTGHSLGAGVSVLLGIKLRAKYPHVRVFAFSTPASLISREAAKFTESFVMTVGVGDDVVMRMGVHSIEAFKDRMLQVIHNTKIPKYRIMLSGFGFALFGVPIRNLEPTSEELDDDLESHPNDPIVLETFERNTSSVMACSAAMPRLYAGGSILQIAKRREDENAPRAGVSTYEVRWTTPEDYMDVKVTPRMLLDHMPDNVIKAVETVLKEKDSYGDEYPIMNKELRTLRETVLEF